MNQVRVRLIEIIRYRSNIWKNGEFLRVSGKPGGAGDRR
jgi:hypothetical protein